MGSFARNCLCIFIPEGRETLIPRIISALASPGAGDGGRDLPLDFEKIMPGGAGSRSDTILDIVLNGGTVDNTAYSPSTDLWGCRGNAIFDDDGDALFVSEVDDHCGYENMGRSTKIEWVFLTKNGSPDGIMARLDEAMQEIGLGMTWEISGDEESYWDPVAQTHQSPWTRELETHPGDVSETEIAVDPVRDINFQGC